MNRYVTCGLLLLALFLPAGTAVPAAAVPAAAPAPAARLAAAPALQQFTTNGHVLGFSSAGIYAASADHAWHVEFVGGNAVEPESSAAGAAAGAMGAPPFDRVTWHDLWPGVTLTYQAAGGDIAESVYTVEPGASAGRIRLRYNGNPRLNADGSLALAFDRGEMQESAPVAWQEIGGRRVPVEAAFTHSGGDEVGFAVGSYDPAYPLTIDPRLKWVEFLGGSDADTGYAIAVDSASNVYVAGRSTVAWGAPVRAYTKGMDGFVAKLDVTGATVWTTFLGGAADDEAKGIAVDANGNAYVTGNSAASWGTPIRPHGSVGDAFVAKLTSAGTLAWNTFLGGDGQDTGTAIAVTAGGTIFVAGNSNATWGAPVRAFSAGLDGFAARLDPTGNLVWNTFLGGAGSDATGDIAVDASGNSTIAGIGDQGWGSPKRALTGDNDAFVARLNANGGLVWNTFLGGAGDDHGQGVTLDGSGNAYVSGWSSAAWGSPVNAFVPWYDVFVARLTTAGDLAWSTFVGSMDEGPGVAVDASGHVYVAGYASSSWGNPTHDYSGNYDGYEAQLNATTGALIWSSFVGGPDHDEVKAVAVDGSADIYVTGYSDESWGSPKHPYAGGFDAFVAKTGPSGIQLWNTFLGGTADDLAFGMAVAADGSVFVTGQTVVAWGSPAVGPFGGPDAFLVRMGSAGNVLWATVLGGTGWDTGRAVAPDQFGNVWVTGSSNASWGSPLHAYSGGGDGWAAEVNSLGQLLWNTFVGGSGSDACYGIALDLSRNVDLACYSGASWGSPVRPYSGGNDGVVAKLYSNGTPIWNTFLGGTGSDDATAITVDGNSAIFVAGTSSATWGSPWRAYSGGNDAYAARLNPATGALEWNSFLGGGGSDSADAIVYDPINLAVYVVGDSTQSWGNPFVPWHGGLDVFVAHLNSDGSLGWNAFFGGSGTDSAGSISLDKDRQLYITGDSTATWGNPFSPYQGGRDAFAAKFTWNADLTWNTFLGSANGTDYGTGIGVDTTGQVYVTGHSNAEWGADAQTSDFDVFVTRIDPRKMTFLPMLRR